MQHYPLARANQNDSNGSSSSGRQAYHDYYYDPSMAAAIIFIVLFGLQAVWHSTLAIRSRAWFWLPFLIGIIFEMIGYIGRAINASETPDWVLGPYILQLLLILLGPILLAASIYMLLARIIRLTDGERFSLIRSTWITKIFVTSDIISFFAQAGGGGLQASKNTNTQKTGQNVVVAGLFLQLLLFGFFVVLTMVFHYRIDRKPTPKVESLPKTVQWRRQLFIIYAASALIIVRNVFRVVEYLQGRQGYLQTHEYVLYVFDATLMFFVTCLFSVWFPGDVISGQARGHWYQLYSRKRTQGRFDGMRG